MSQYWILFSASTPIFLIIGLGAFIRHIGWLSWETDDDLVRILIWILMPALVLDRMVGNPALNDPVNLIVAPSGRGGSSLLGLCRLPPGSVRLKMRCI